MLFINWQNCYSFYRSFITNDKYVHRFIMFTPFYNNNNETFSLSFSVIVLAYEMFYQFLYPCPYFSFLQVIGGDLQERLIPVPYSKSTTDQAVREIQYLLYCCSKSIYFHFYILFLSTPTYAFFNVYFCMDVLNQFVMLISRQIFPTFFICHKK